MRVVDHHARAVFPRERYDFRQLCDVAAHAEYAVGHDQAARRFGHLFQLNFELLHVRMGRGEHSAVAQLAAVVNAGVIFLVADHVIAVPDDCGNDAEIRLKAGRERAAGFLVQEIRQFLLQLQMQLQRAVQKARTGTAGSVLLQRFQPRFEYLRTGGQPQVIVRAEHDPALAFHDDFDVLPAFQRVKIGVNALGAQIARDGIGFTFIE